MTAPIHTKESIQQLLDTNERAVYKALLAIYSRQTAAEQAGHHTREVNGVGFSRFDAPFLTDMVRGYMRYGSLTPRQLAPTRNKMKRYWRQLLEIANSRTPSLYLPQPEPSAKDPTMELVSPDTTGDYLGSRTRPRVCGCEDNDGEVLFEDCDRCMGSEFGRYEARVEAERYARRGTW
jgi:hypothetical protein